MFINDIIVNLINSWRSNVFLHYGMLRLFFINYLLLFFTYIMLLVNNRNVILMNIVDNITL